MENVWRREILNEEVLAIVGMKAGRDTMANERRTDRWFECGIVENISGLAVSRWASATGGPRLRGGPRPGEYRGMK